LLNKCLNYYKQWRDFVSEIGIIQKLKNFGLEILKAASILAPLFAPVVLIFWIYGEELAIETVWLLVKILASLLGLKGAFTHLKALLRESTDAVQNLKSTKNVLENGSCTVLLPIAAVPLLVSSLQSLAALKDGDIFAIIAMVVIVIAAVLLYKMTKRSNQHL